MAKKKYNHGPIYDAFKELDKATSNMAEDMNKSFKACGDAIGRAFTGTKKHSAIMKMKTVQDKTDTPKPAPKKPKKVYFWNRFFRDDYTKKRDGEYDR